MKPSSSSKPPPHPSFLISYPHPSILLLTINRPHAMNSIPRQGHWEADALLNWYDATPSLIAAIITGSGSKAFCAGQDLIEAAGFLGSPPIPQASNAPATSGTHPSSGFCGISRRVGKKPIIAAVNGFALGGGFELCLNCDIVIASPHASFGLPEPAVGLYAAAGGLSRLVRICGMQIASEIALTNRKLSAQEALGYGLVNRVAKTRESVLEESIEMAMKIVDLSPDAVIVTKAGLRESWEKGSVEEATRTVAEKWNVGIFGGENAKIGLEAFGGKKKPIWVESKL